jgi:hypothetical protein
MSTERLPVELKRVNYFDGKQITRDDLQDEQNRHVGIDAANVANFMGSGVVGDVAEPPVILDTNDLNSQQQTLLDGYSFDGQDVYIGSSLVSPSDSTQGVQLSVTISGADLSGAVSSKVSIIGEEFGDNLIHDDLVFDENGSQITQGRYKTILGIVFNNFAGNLFGSLSPALDGYDGYDLVGRCLIREAKPLEVSRDPLMASQNSQPDQFWGNFITGSATQTLNQLLQEIIESSRSLADLNISLASTSQREISADDVTTRIGQKFQALGTNIQKVSMLVSVQEDTTAPSGDEYRWSGQIVATLNALQTSVDCPTTPVPDNLEDFDPDPTIVAQLTLSVDDLADQGVVLDGYAQKVDFVFTGATISDPVNTPIIQDRYYIVTFGRSGNASVGDLLFEEAVHSAPNGYMTIYNGAEWVNITESDMWFEIYGDYVKVADGTSYQSGIGTEVPRLEQSSSGVEEPYIEDTISFYTSAMDTANFVLVENSSEFSETEQDPRTGNDISSRVAPVPSISMISNTSLTTLLSSEISPLILAKVWDGNPRGNPDSISGTTDTAGLVFENTIHVIAPDADLRSNNVVNSLLVPNTSASNEYRIISQTLYSDSYGDVNGDGEIDTSDLSIVNSWISTYGSIDLTIASGQQIVIDGDVAIEQVLRADVNGDGKVDATDVLLIQDFINGDISTFPAGGSFSRMALVVEEKIDPLDSEADMPSDDSSFTTTPFSSVSWRIDYKRSWIPDFIEMCDMRRLLPTTFTEPPDGDICFGGRNDFLIPGNALIDGYINNVDGTPYPVDLEVNHLSLRIPVTDSDGDPTSLDGYTSLLLFDNFVAESSDGKTASGFTAMRYSDLSYVQIGDFTDGKVKITASIQSHANEYPVTSSPFEDIVGTYYDPSTSLLVLRMDDLLDDGYGNLLPSQTTRILVTVYLKKAGFVNDTQEVTEAQMRNLLGI